MKPERAGTILTRPSDVRVPARAPRWVMPAVKTALAVGDVMVTLASFIGAFYLREGETIITETAGQLGWSAAFAPYAQLLPFVLILRISTFAYYDLYRLRGEFSLVEDGIRVFKAAAAGSLLIVATAFLYRGVFEFRSFSYSRSVFVLDFLIALTSLGLTRLSVRGVQTFARHRDFNLIPTLVVGKGPEARPFIEEMRRRPELGYRVIGVVENGFSRTSSTTTFDGIPIIGDLSRLADAIRDSQADEVIITDPTVPPDTLFDVMMQIGRGRVEFRMAPSLFNFLPRKTEIDQIGALPMITLFRSPLSRAARVVKRASDVVIGSAAGLLLLPFSLIIALLIKLDSSGPVLFKQERVGMDGRIFLLYKFRTMRANADASLHREAYKKNIAGLAEANDGDTERPSLRKHSKLIQESHG